MTCSKEQQQIIMLPAKRRKGPTLWSPQFCARFSRKCPRAASTHFPIPKLQAWCFWSYLLLSCPSPLSSPLLIHPFNTIFFSVCFPFLNFVHLCFPVCLSYYQTALLASSRTNFWIAVSLIYRSILHSWLTVLHPTLCALPVPVSFIWQTLLQFVLLPLLQLPGFWTYQHTEDWLERSSDPYTKLKLNPMLAPSKAFFLFALLSLMQRPPHNSAPEGRCQRHPKESKALHSRDMSLNTRQAGAEFSVLKFNPASLLKQFR